MYGKIINGEFQIAPTSLKGDGVTIYNPPEAMYLAQGWKSVTLVDSPEAPEGYYYEPGWEERADAIVQIWALVPVPDEIEELEAYNIIFGGSE